MFAHSGQWALCVVLDMTLVVVLASAAVIRWLGRAYDLCVLRSTVL